MPHLIEPARSSRSRCQLCWQRIEKDEPRLAEEYVSSHTRTVAQRFHHLACAADHRPLVLRSALRGYNGPLAEREALEHRIGVSLERERQRRAARRPTDDEQGDALEQALLARLVLEPDDGEALLVYADLLQRRGEPRGELIVLQHELRHGQDSARKGQLLRRQTELLERHPARLAPPLLHGDRVEWQSGFVRRLELCGKSGSRLPETPELLAHPSLRLLAELRVAFFMAPDGAAAVEALAVRAPCTLRSLTLGDSYEHSLGPVERLVAGLPVLERLTLEGRTELERLAHPTLQHLELHNLDWSYEGGAPGALARLEPGHLPGLHSLGIGGSQSTDDLCRVLAERSWLEQLTDLNLSQGTMTRLGAEAIAEGLGRRHLARLVVSDNQLTPSCRKLLEPRCDRLVFGEQHTGLGPGHDEGWFIRHRRKPEWGRGRVLRQFDDKLEVEFDEAGRKVLKADASFLESV